MSPQEPIGDFGSIKVDEYGEMGSKAEGARLDDFAKELREQPDTQAYVIAYAGSRWWQREAKHRANCAKEYLITRQGIAKGRIVAVDGGYQEGPIVSRYIKLPDAKHLPPSQLSILAKLKS